MNLKALKEIAAKNLKLAFRYAFPISLIVPVIAVMVFPSAGLNKAQASKPLEMFVCFVGVVLMSAVFLPEKDGAIFEAVFVRRISIKTIRLIRTIMAIVMTICVVTGFCWYLKANECVITNYMILGGITDALFMGSIVFFVATVSENVFDAIMAAVVFYIVNYGLKDKLGPFFLFSMTNGSFAGKGWMLTGAGALLAFGFACKTSRGGR